MEFWHWDRFWQVKCMEHKKQPKQYSPETKKANVCIQTSLWETLVCRKTQSVLMSQLGNRRVIQCGWSAERRRRWQPVTSWAWSTSWCSCVRSAIIPTCSTLDRRCRRSAWKASSSQPHRLCFTHCSKIPLRLVVWTPVTINTFALDKWVSDGDVRII